MDQTSDNYSNTDILLRSDQAEHPDVLVVGAGPVGLTAAIALRLAGLKVAILDRKTAPASTSRALGTHARTLEVYRHLGVLDTVRAASQPVATFTVHERGKVLTAFRYDFAALGPQVPSSAFIAQADTEAILRKRLSALGVDVEWGLEMQSLVDEGDGVRIVLSNGSVRRAAWLVGADGGHSRTRRLLGLPFEGSADETWIVTDAEIDEGDLPRNSIHMLRNARGNLLLFPFPEKGRWRVLETNPPPEGEERDQARLAAAFEARIRESLGRSVGIRRLTWVSRFTIQQRQVPRLRVGRVMLAGDAAHVHSPASGQGMNTGIQDAFNLGWKLALVQRGQAREALLDSYDAERRPVSTKLLASAKIATRLIQSRRGLTYLLARWAVRMQQAIAPLHRKIERRITAQFSALDLAYDDGEPAAPLHAGRRLAALPPSLLETPETQAFLDWLAKPGLKVLFAGSGSHVLAEAIDRTPLRAAPFDVGILSDELGPLTLADPEGQIAEALGGSPQGTAWVVRPDGYLVGRFHRPEIGAMVAAMDRFGLVPRAEVPSVLDRARAPLASSSDAP